MPSTPSPAGSAPDAARAHRAGRRLAALLDLPTVLRLVLGWGGVLATILLAGPLSATLPAGVLVAVLAAIIAVIVVCALGVVHQAEALARLLGDPYGTLVLTLSIVTIEVVLIAAVLLGPGEHPTIGRDSVSAVSMIILNLVMGVCLLAAALARRPRRPAAGRVAVGPAATAPLPRANPRGAVVYLVLLTVLGFIAFALPALIGEDGSFSRAQEVPIVLLTIGVYVLFLVLQTGRGAADFQEVGTGSAPASASARSLGALVSAHRGELLVRAAILVATALPIVLLSHRMADLLDDGLARLGAPTALGGLLIALIVFTPESITAVRAAIGGEMQRVVNLCHGALVSTVGLTIPVVLAISLLTGAHVISAESPAMLAMLGASLALTAVTLLSRRPGPVHGVAHLVLFAVYGVLLLS
ncbi:calcium:proton antiporter [Brachybacterium sp. DNPG3]